MPTRNRKTSSRKPSRLVLACSSVSSCLFAAVTEARTESKNWIEDKIHKLKEFRHWRIVGFGLIALLLWIAGFYFLIFSAPVDFPQGAIVRVRKGSSVSVVAEGLEQKRLIKYATAFKLLSRIGGDNKVIAGDYKFSDPVSVFTIYERISRGVYGIDPIRVTIYEGHNVREIADLLDKSLPAFEKDVFIKEADGREGRLFPDTYLIQPMDDENDIVNMMATNFDTKFAPIEMNIAASGHSRNEILTMASIIELEAKTMESRKIISGILWNRIKKKMKLQVDAVFPYIMNKYSLQLTVKDLMFDSPYNTYRYAGLPPAPVGNPGLGAIEAALNPTKTDYLYYLSDRNGEMHYAKTYKAHMINRAKYLGGS